MEALVIPTIPSLLPKSYVSLSQQPWVAAPIVAPVLGQMTLNVTVGAA